MHRLLVETKLLEEVSPVLPADAARHLKVLRPKDGEKIELFDGRGKWRVYSFCGDRNVAAPLEEGSRRGVATFLSPQTTLAIHSKCDLGHGEGLNVSAKTGEGLDELKRAIVAKLEEKVAASDCGDSPEGDVAAYHEALALLNGGLETRDGRREEDLVLMANDVRAAAERLGAAVGATYSSDMLDKLFSRFCVGK